MHAARKAKRGDSKASPYYIPYTSPLPTVIVRTKLQRKQKKRVTWTRHHERGALATHLWDEPTQKPRADGCSSAKQSTPHPPSYQLYAEPSSRDISPEAKQTKKTRPPHPPSLGTERIMEAARPLNCDLDFRTCCRTDHHMMIVLLRLGWPFTF